MTAARPLLLASGSPRRAALLRAAGIPFEIDRLPPVDETVPAGLSPRATVARLAARKARAARERHPDRLLLAADTLVFLDGAAMGKPADAAEAKRMLRRLSGVRHEVATGVAVADAERLLVDSAVTSVRFRALADAEIEAYVATGEPLDKAGAYAIQGGAAAFVAAREGDLDTVIGLPVGLVRRLLARWGR